MTGQTITPEELARALFEWDREHEEWHGEGRAPIWAEILAMRAPYEERAREIFALADAVAQEEQDNDED